MDPDWERWQPVLDALALHPAYAETFQNSLAYIFYGDGPVIQCSRLYIVLMVKLLLFFAHSRLLDLI